MLSCLHFEQQLYPNFLNLNDSILFVKSPKQQMYKNEQDKAKSRTHLTFALTTENNLFSLESVQAIGISQMQYSVLEHISIRSLFLEVEQQNILLKCFMERF